MSNVLFVSDLHLGHKNIQEFSAKPGAAPRGNGTTVEEHDEWVIEQCLKAKCSKNTLWYILGDVCMDAWNNDDTSRLSMIDRLPGRKILIMGNHDDLHTSQYLDHFIAARGPLKAYGMWISHTPLQDIDLWGCPNIHGHQHYNPLAGDPDYFNACIEWLPEQQPVDLEWLREHWLPKTRVGDKDHG